MAKIDDYSLYWCPPDSKWLKEYPESPQEKHWTNILRVFVWIVEISALILFVWACSILG